MTSAVPAQTAQLQSTGSVRPHSILGGPTAPA